MDDGEKILAISVPPSNQQTNDMVVRSTATGHVRSIPDGEEDYTFEYIVRCITGVPFKAAVITSDSLHIVAVAADKTNRDCLMVFNAKTGSQLHKVSLKASSIKVCYNINLDKQVNHAYFCRKSIR